MVTVTLQFCLGVFTQKNFMADFIRPKLSFIHKNEKNRLSVLSHPLEDLGVTYALHL